MGDGIHRAGPSERRALDPDLEVHFRALVAQVRGGSTEPEPAAEPEPIATAELQHGLFMRLVHVLKRDGFEILKHPLPFAGDGMVRGSRIYVADNGYKLLTLIHEHAHVLLHSDPGPQLPEYLHRLYFPSAEYHMPVSPHVAECDAESVAYLVMSHFGFTARRSVAYLVEQGTTADEIEAQADPIRWAAAVVIQRLGEP